MGEEGVRVLRLDPVGRPLQGGRHVAIGAHGHVSAG
jgi:hypothetical protein